MKLVFILLLILSSIIAAQENLFNKDYEIRKFIEMGGNVEEISPDVYKFIYPDGNLRVFNFNAKMSLNLDNLLLDTTIINMWEIDTTKYKDRFTFWQKVNIFNLNYYVPPLVEDLNRNGMPEIYGRHNLAGPVEIYERNTSGIFTSIYAYPDSDTYSVKALGEIHGTGEKEIYISRNDYNNGDIYKSDFIGALPTTFDFTFYYGSQFAITDMTFGDWDKNVITDCAFVSADSLGPLIIVSEFRDSLNNFITLFEKHTADTIQGNHPSGFAIGDFDNDDKTELIAGSTWGIIYSIEAREENKYELNWQGNIPTQNAYMNTSTNDIDYNGKPEFWIGGQDFVEGTTRFQAYEAVSDNNYQAVALIELRYINSLYTNYIQAKDVDGDGKEELVISLANVILILKFTGSANHHRYEIYYAKIGEATQPGCEFEPLTIADLNGNNKLDLLLPISRYYNGQTHIFSYILRNNVITGTETSNIKAFQSEEFIKSYPVPFNSASSIIFSISNESYVKLKVFNSLGKEIKTLLDKNLSPGEYSIHWEAEDDYGNQLPSGVYFISLQTDYVLKTIKTILLK